MIILMTTVLFKSFLGTYPTGLNLWVNRCLITSMQTNSNYSCPSDNKGFPAFCGFKGKHFGVLNTITSRQKLEQHLHSWGKEFLCYTESGKDNIWLPVWVSLAYVLGSQFSWFHSLI